MVAVNKHLMEIDHQINTEKKEISYNGQYFRRTLSQELDSNYRRKLKLNPSLSMTHYDNFLSNLVPLDQSLRIKINLT